MFYAGILVTVLGITGLVLAFRYKWKADELMSKVVTKELVGEDIQRYIKYRFLQQLGPIISSVSCVIAGIKLMTL